MRPSRRGDDPADRLMGPAAAAMTTRSLISGRSGSKSAVRRPPPCQLEPSAGYRFASAHQDGWDIAAFSRGAHRVCSLPRALSSAYGIEAGTLAALAGVGRAPGRSGMVTRTLRRAAMSKLARLPAGNGTDAGVPRVRVAARDGPAATGCLLAGGGDSPDLAGGPGPMPLTLASTSVPRAARLSHGRAGPCRRVEPTGRRGPPARRGPVRCPAGCSTWAAHPAAEAAARTAAAADRLRRRRRRTTATRPSSPSKSASGGPGESCGRSPDGCVTAPMGTLRSRAGSPASPAASSGTAGTTPDAGRLSRGRLG